MQDLSENSFPGMLNKLYAESFTSDVVKAGFRATGIFPFNAGAVPLEGMENRPHVYRDSTESSDSPTSSLTISSSLWTGNLLVEPLPNADVATSSAIPTLAAPVSPEVVNTPSENTNSDSSVSKTVSSTTPILIKSQPTLKEFFLKQLQPQCSKSSRGRSARVQRFRYGESLTTSECVEWMK